MSRTAENDTATAGRWILDVALLVALASAAWKALAGDWDAVVRFSVVAVLMYSPRAAKVPPPFAAGFATFLLLATWAGVEHWYRQISWFDVMVHFLTPGSLAAAAYFALVHWRVMPAPSDDRPGLRTWSPLVWVTGVGVTGAVLWEFYEWVINQIRPQSLLLRYSDTILDLFAGTLGSLVASGLVLWWSRTHSAAGRGS